MKSAVLQPMATPTVNNCAELSRPSLHDQEKPRPVSWGALYTVFLVSVGLCVGGGHLVAAIGHSALIQYGVALAIIGLLTAWVRRSRSALSSHEVQARLEQPFSVIHVPMSPQSESPGQRALGVLSNTERHGAEVHPTTKSSRR